MENNTKIQKQRECSKRWYAKNKEKQKVLRKKRYEANRAKVKAQTRAWKLANPEKLRHHKRAEHLKSYGLKTEDYNIMSVCQGHVCAICGNPNLRGQNLCVDHDHKTNEPRGLLCNNCNLGLGFFADSPVHLTNAISYLNKYNKTAPIS